MVTTLKELTEEPGLSSGSNPSNTRDSAVRHIIFVNRYFYPDESATSQILSDLTFHLARQGNHVSVISSQLNYRLNGRNFPSRELVDGVDIHRIWTTQYNREHLIGRSIDFISFYVSSIIKLLSLCNRYSLVVLKTDPPMLGAAVSPLLRLKRVPYINWLQDLFPEVAQAAGFSVAGGLLGIILQKLRNRSLKGAQMNVVIGNRMLDRLVASGISRKKIICIPNWSAGENVVPIPIDMNPLRSEWGLEGEFVVGYSGNFGRVHQFQTLLDAAKLLLPYSQIKFVLIGHGVKLGWVQRFAQEHNLTNVIFKPFQPRSRLQESLGVADVHIVSLLPSMEGLIVPSKTYGIAAAGRPVIFIGDRTGEIAELLERHDFGSSVSIDDSQGLASAILTLADRPEHCAKWGENARLAFDTSYSDVVALAKWKTLVDRHFDAVVS